MEQNHVGYLLKQLSDKMQAYADASLKKYNVTFSQAQVLEFVPDQGGRATQKAIEDHLGVSHPTVVGLISRLEKSGFLHCYMDTADRRNKIVCMTPYAEKVDRLMRQARAVVDRRLTESLSQEEVKELERMLGVLYVNVCGTEKGGP